MPQAAASKWLDQTDYFYEPKDDEEDKIFAAAHFTNTKKVLLGEQDRTSMPMGRLQTFTFVSRSVQISAVLQ